MSWFDFFAKAKLWLWVWGPCLALGTLQALTSLGNDNTLLLQILLALAVSLAFLWLSRFRGVGIASFSLLVIITVSGSMIMLQLRQGWLTQRAADSQVVVSGFSKDGFTFGIASNTERLTAYREWELSPKATQLTLHFDVRQASNQLGWDWRHNENVILKSVKEDETNYTRVIPMSSGPWISRQYDVRGALSARTFKVTFRARAVHSANQACLRFTLLQDGSSEDRTIRKNQRLCLTPEWQTYKFTWTPPAEADSHLLNVVFSHFPKVAFDISNVTLTEVTTGRERIWGPPAPIGLFLEFDWRRDDKSLTRSNGIRLLPAEEWKSYAVSVDRPNQIAHLNSVRVIMWLERHTAIEIRDVVLTANGQTQTPINKQRISWGLGHPNLLGHSIVTLSLIATIFLKSTWLKFVAGTLGIVGIWLTGSRTAFVIFTLMVGVLLYFMGQKRSKVYFGIAVGIALLIFIFWNLSYLGRIQTLGYLEDFINRLEIWLTAWQALLSHPLTGIGRNEFFTYWQTVHSESSLMVTHAHNLWLQFAASYGIPGLLAILWLTGGFIYLAWRWGRWRGLALVLPVLLMQVFDYTFFYAGVLFPLILGMNSLRDSNEQ